MDEGLYDLEVFVTKDEKVMFRQKQIGWFNDMSEWLEKKVK